MASQLPLFDLSTLAATQAFPSTRYQGSKRKLIEWIWLNVEPLEFATCLDAFGGTGVVSYLFKKAGKTVTYNDILRFNWNNGLALIENANTQLSAAEVETLLTRQSTLHYPDWIARTFAGIYFTDSENQWLDQTVTNIDHLLDNPFKQAIARFALCQACIIKRPYNLFHRANLYMRQADVQRSFGNKVTWDTPFADYFRKFVAEANAAIFDNGKSNRALQMDASATPNDYDLVYLDPPYLNARGVGVDYRDFYHFLEGLLDYAHWEEQIDLRSKHRRLKPQKSPWHQPAQILDAFKRVIEHHQKSILVISYRDDGIPTPQELVDTLKHYKSKVTVLQLPQKYVLSKQNLSELLVIAQ